MKRCPECRRDYYDETLLYCLDDGSALLEGPASVDESPTSILSGPGATGFRDGDVTRPYINITESKAELRRIKEAFRKSTAFRLGEQSRLLPRRLRKLFLSAVISPARYFNRGSSGSISSIAVMPFENKSSDADTDYLSDGFAESLIYRLSHLPDLKVSPTNSVFR